MTATQTVVTLETLTLEDVKSVYSGKNGKCMCGCAGKHYYKNAMGDYRGGGTKNDVKQVNRIFNIVKSAQDVENGGTYFATVIEERIYVVYVDFRADGQSHPSLVSTTAKR